MCVWFGQLFLFLLLSEKLSGRSLIEHPGQAKDIRMSYPEQTTKLQPIKWISLRLLGELLFGALQIHVMVVRGCSLSLTHHLSPTQTLLLSLCPFISSSAETVWIITAIDLHSLPRVHSGAQRNRHLFESKHTNIHDRERWIYIIHGPNYQFVYISPQNMALSVSKIN